MHRLRQHLFLESLERSDFNAILNSVSWLLASGFWLFVNIVSDKTNNLTLE